MPTDTLVPVKDAAKIPTLLRSEVVLCTSNMARMLRDKCHFPRQRPLSETHIARLAEEMTLGSFIAGTQIWFAIYPDRSMAILNGNHTLEAVFRSKIPLALTFTYTPCADENDAGRIYAQFDVHKARTWNDSYRAYGFTDEIPQYWATPVGTAVGWICSKFDSNIAKSGGKSREIRALMMKKYAKQAHLAIGITEGVSTQNLLLLRRGAVLAVALETLRYQPTLAQDFWRPMLLDDGLKSGNPRKALLNFLRKTTGQNGRASAALQARGCAACWNAAFKGRDMDYPKPALMDGFVLAGTPWREAGDHDPMTELTTGKIYRPSIPTNPVDRPAFVTGIVTGQDGAQTAAVYYAP